MGEILTTRSAPYDAEIEYLESTGTQYIDTGFNFGNVDRLEFATTVKQRGTHNYWCLLGANSNSNEVLIWFHAGSTYLNGKSSSIPLSYNTEYVIDLIVTNGSASLSVNNNVVATSTGKNNGKHIYLFGSIGTASAVTIDSYNYQVFRYCKIYSGNTLVRDLIPVRVGQVGYMYDRVSKSLFGNAGSGNFKLGKDIHWTKTLNTRIKNRYDTEENWLTENPILLSGETAFTDISGVHKCKVGDGETPYTGLPYVNNMDEAMIIRKWRD